MEQPRDAVVDHDLPQVLVVQDISKDERTWRRWEQWGIGSQGWMEGRCCMKLRLLFLSPKYITKQRC